MAFDWLRDRSGRLFAELVVIVLGVLIALWMDSVQQRSEERATEQVMLAALLDELGENRAELDELMSWMERRHRAQRLLIEVAEGRGTVDSDSLDVLFSWAHVGGTYSPANGVLTSIIASGQLRIFDDAILRVLIGQWSSEVESIISGSETYNTVLGNDFWPPMKERYTVPSSAGDAYPVPGTVDRVALERALTDTEVTNNLRHLASFWPIFQDIGARASEHLSRLEERVRANLDGRDV